MFQAKRGRSLVCQEVVDGVGDNSVNDPDRLIILSIFLKDMIRFGDTGTGATEQGRDI